MLKADMHTHSQNSHDSKCTVIDMATYESQNGISVLAVTDHIDIEYHHKINLHAVATGAFSEVDKAREACGDKIKILKGLEMGEAFWYPEVAKEILQNHPCDVVIGSVHAVQYKDLTMPFSTIDFSALSEDVILDYLSKYFEDYEQMITSTDLDIAAHLTCPIYYINVKYKRNIDIHVFDKQMHRILEKVIQRGIALEVNTHYIQSMGGYMPDEAILKAYFSMGGRKITTGSDAHISKDAALGFDTLYPMLANIGFEHVCYFENREAVYCSLKGETK